MTYEQIQKMIEIQKVESFIYETTNPLRVRRGQGRVELTVEGEAFDEIRNFLSLDTDTEYAVEGGTIRFQDKNDQIAITLK